MSHGLCIDLQANNDQDYDKKMISLDLFPPQNFGQLKQGEEDKE